MGQHPDQFLPGSCLLFFQNILDILDGTQQNYLVLYFKLRCKNGQLKDIFIILHLYQLILARIYCQQSGCQFFT